MIDRQNMLNAYNDVPYPVFHVRPLQMAMGNRNLKKGHVFDVVRIGDENSSYDEVKPDGSNSI